MHILNIFVIYLQAIRLLHLLKVEKILSDVYQLNNIITSSID